MKKTTAILLSLLLLLAVPLQVITSAESAGTFAAGTGSAFPGRTVQIPITIENNPGMVACLVHVSYDSSILTLQSVQNGDLFDESKVVFGNNLAAIPYNLIWEDSLSHTDFTQNGTFATLTFQVSDSAPAGETTIAVSFDQGSTFNTNLEDAAFETQNGSVTVRALQQKTLTVKTMPAKTTYWAGETLDTAGLVLTYTDEYATATDLTSGFTCTPTVLNAAGTQTITVSYEGVTASFDVTVNALLEKSLSVKTMPTQTTYWVGETLDTDGLVLTYSDEHGSVSDLTSGFTCAPTALNTAGTQTITVSYGGLTTSFDVTVNALLEKTLTVKTIPEKTTYWIGEALDTTGLVLTYSNEYGFANDVWEGFGCTPTALNTAGTQTITVSYDGLTTSFNVTVNALLEETLTVKTMPAKTTYWVGETLSTTGLVLTYSDKYGDTVDLTSGFTCAPTVLNTAGTQTITVSFEGVTASFDVTVNALLEKTLTVKTMPDKTTYLVGETLDTTGLVLTYSDEYGAAADLTSGFVCTPTTLDTAGTQVITASYNGVTASFDVTVNAPAADPVFAVGSGSAAPGETVSIPVRIENNPGVIALRLFVTYDTNLLTLQSASSVNLFSSGDVILGNDLSTVPYRMLWEDSLSRVNHTESGDFAILTFLVKNGAAAGETPLTISYEAGSTFDTDLNSVAFTVRGGSVTINPLLEPTLVVKTAPTKIVYTAGETLDTAGLVLTYTDAYGVATDVTTGFTCAPTALGTAGTQTITVTYNGLTATFDVTVEEAPEEGGWSFAEGTDLHIHTSTQNEIQFVTGLNPEDPVVSDYVITTGGWRCEVELNELYTESTGAVMNIYNADDDLVESYVIILFGDVDGDSAIDGQDAAMILDVKMGYYYAEWIDYDCVDDFVVSYAADVNHDFIVDGQDANFIFDEYMGFTGAPNQSWNEYGDDIYV